MRPRGTSIQLAVRRRLAMSLLDEGESLDSVASMLGVHRTSVLRWRRAFQSQGREGLKPLPHPGRPKKLSSEGRERLHALLLQGPQAHGLETDTWFAEQIRQLIETEFGVSYHRSHIGRLLKTIGWTHRRGGRGTERSGWCLDSA